MESTQNCPQACRKHIISTRHDYSRKSLIFPPISPDISYGSNWAHHFPDFCLTSSSLAINHTSHSPEPLSHIPVRLSTPAALIPDVIYNVQKEHPFLKDLHASSLHSPHPQIILPHNPEIHQPKTLFQQPQHQPQKP